MCKPIKLNIQLDQSVLGNEKLVLEKLKQASPQEFWYNQVVASESENSSKVAAGLLNTRHSVKDEIAPSTYNPVTSYDFHPHNPAVQIPVRPTGQQSSARVDLSPSTVIGHSTPEQVAPREEQNIIKLKMLIQQVIQEMAEGTV
jgi:hypothetical protein